MLNSPLLCKVKALQFILARYHRDVEKIKKNNCLHCSKRKINLLWRSDENGEIGVVGEVRMRYYGLLAVLLAAR